MKYLEDAMYGGVDGILSAFNFLVIMQSAKFPKAYILWILILKLLSDGVSLSLSNYSGKLAKNEIRETLENKEQFPIDNPYMSGFVTLLGFLIFGSIPILIYHYVLHDTTNTFLSVIIIIVTLFILGSLKTFVITYHTEGLLRGGTELSAVGMIGIIASMIIGTMIHRVAGHKYV